MNSFDTPWTFVITRLLFKRQISVTKNVDMLGTYHHYKNLVFRRVPIKWQELWNLFTVIYKDDIFLRLPATKKQKYMVLPIWSKSYGVYDKISINLKTRNKLISWRCMYSVRVSSKWQELCFYFHLKLNHSSIKQPYLKKKEFESNLKLPSARENKKHIGFPINKQDIILEYPIFKIHM